MYTNGQQITKCYQYWCSFCFQLPVLNGGQCQLFLLILSAWRRYAWIWALLFNEYEIFLTISYFYHLIPMVMLFRNIVASLGGGTLTEKVGALYLYSSFSSVPDSWVYVQCEQPTPFPAAIMLFLSTAMPLLSWWTVCPRNCEQK